MNWRLDNPPTIDVSVSRHMGLFAVARLAERHRVRVRLRPAPPQGLSALVWLPDSVIERTEQARPGHEQLVGAAGRRAATRAGGGVRRPRAGRAGQPRQRLLDRTGRPGNGYSTGQRQPWQRLLERRRARDPALEGRTASGWFRGGQDGAGRPAAGTLGGQDAGFAPDWGPGSRPRPPPSASRHTTDQTASGLPVRVPRASHAAGRQRWRSIRRPGRTAQGGGARHRAREAAPGRRTAATRCRGGHRTRHAAASPGSSAERAGRKGKAAAVARRHAQERGPEVELRIPSGPELARQRLHRARARRGARGRGLRRRRAAVLVRRDPRRTSPSSSRPSRPASPA